MIPDRPILQDVTQFPGQSADDAQAQRRLLIEELALPDTPEPSKPGRSFKWLTVVLLLALTAGSGGWVLLRVSGVQISELNMSEFQISDFEIPDFQMPDFQMSDLQIPGIETSSDNAQQAVAVSTAIVRLDKPARNDGVALDATGYVVARRQAAVSSKITGTVAEIFIEEGMFVKTGQLLARLDDLIPRAEYELANAQLEGAKLAIDELEILLGQAMRNQKRVKVLAERGFANDAARENATTDMNALRAQVIRARQAITVAELRAAVQRQVLANTEIRAPFSGIVTMKSAQPGETISPLSTGGGFARTGICTIVDMDSLEVQVDVNESLIHRVHVKQRVEVTLNSHANKPYPAKVSAIIPAADRNKATIRVRIGFTQRDSRILPGMGVRVSFSDTQASPAARTPPGLTVPETAVASDRQGTFVFTFADGVPTRRSVKVLKITGARMKVISGLTEGERVVVNLSDELRTQLANDARITLDY